MTEIRVLRLPHGADLPLPAYHSAQAAGLDLIAAVPADKPIAVLPGGRVSIPTGIAIALPPGHVPPAGTWRRLPDGRYASPLPARQALLALIPRS